MDLYTSKVISAMCLVASTHPCLIVSAFDPCSQLLQKIFARGTVDLDPYKHPTKYLLLLSPNPPSHLAPSIYTFSICSWAYEEAFKLYISTLLTSHYPYTLHYTITHVSVESPYPAPRHNPRDSNRIHNCRTLPQLSYHL